MVSLIFIFYIYTDGILEGHTREKWSKSQNWAEMVLPPRNCFAGVT